MIPKYEATRAALDHFDAVDQPALDEMCKLEGGAMGLARVAGARRAAADRVRQAFLQDTREFNLAENVELMSVERIRKAAGGTLLGRMLGILP